MESFPSRGVAGGAAASPRAPRGDNSEFVAGWLTGPSAAAHARSVGSASRRPAGLAPVAGCQRRCGDPWSRKRPAIAGTSFIVVARM